MPLERSFYRGLVAGAQAERWGLYRIEDCQGAGLRPFDIGGVAPDGRGVALEVKVWSNVLRVDSVMPWSLFAAHQVSWLRVYCQLGGYPLVGLYLTRSRDMCVYHLAEADFDPTRRLSQVRVVKLAKVRDAYRGWSYLLR